MSVESLTIICSLVKVYIIQNKSSVIHVFFKEEMIYYFKTGCNRVKERKLNFGIMDTLKVIICNQSEGSVQLQRHVTGQSDISYKTLLCHSALVCSVRDALQQELPIECVQEVSEIDLGLFLRPYTKLCELSVLLSMFLLLMAQKLRRGLNLFPGKHAK